MPVLGNVLLEVDGPADALARDARCAPGLVCRRGAACETGAQRVAVSLGALPVCEAGAPSLLGRRGAAAREAGAPSSARPARGAVASETMEVVPCAPRLGAGRATAVG